MFAALLSFIKKNKLLPVMSDTERQALESGTVWVDGELFSGNPDFSKILSNAYSSLSKEEQEFLDGPTDELCRMANRWEIAESRRVPEDIIQFIKDQGFMGLNVPKEHGGKGFSTLGKSAVMTKLVSAGGAVATYVIIPNSLGAAELIHVYGTDEQKHHYLPKLAKGEYVPCFGLTEPTAGSDAASIKAEGIVFKEGDELKIRMNFRKRYITLAPAANLISLAVRVSDPDNHLGKGEDVGITVVLLEKGTDGLQIGDHHLPIGDAFYNGPIIGNDVVVNVNDIIGGTEYAGQGWRMLMEQLAGGRAVSLPAGAVGSMQAAAAVTGPYSMVRQQFGMSIGEMEGIQEPLARINGLTYLFEAARVFTCSAIDEGEAPPVLSAILKQQSTKTARELTINGMDVFSGAGVMQGPNNILGPAYCTAPVSITVEGANIMTRSLIIFGQGAILCHPHARNVVKAVEAEDVPSFRSAMLGWMGHLAMTSIRVVVRGLTRGWSKPAAAGGVTGKYYRRLSWASARYALMTDLAMFLIGGELKSKSKLTGRYADALSWMYLATCTLRRFEAEGRRPEDEVLMRWSVEYALARVQEAFDGMYANFEAPVIGLWLRTIGRLSLKINPLGSEPSDRLGAEVARVTQTLDERYHRLTPMVASADENTAGAGRLIKAMRLLQDAEPHLVKVRKAIKARQLPRSAPESLAQAALEAGIIDKAGANAIEIAQSARLEAIEVDVFTPDEYFRNVAPAGIEQSGIETKQAVNA